MVVLALSLTATSPNVSRVTLRIALVVVESGVGLMKGIKWPQLYVKQLLVDSDIIVCRLEKVSYFFLSYS